MIPARVLVGAFLTVAGVVTMLSQPRKKEAKPAESQPVVPAVPVIDPPAPDGGNVEA